MWSIFKNKQQVLTGQDALYILTGFIKSEEDPLKVTFANRWDQSKTKTVPFLNENQGLTGSIATPYYEGTFHINYLDLPQEE